MKGLAGVRWNRRVPEAAASHRIFHPLSPRNILVTARGIGVTPRGTASHWGWKRCSWRSRRAAGRSGACADSKASGKEVRGEPPPAGCRRHLDLTLERCERYRRERTERAPGRSRSDSRQASPSGAGPDPSCLTSQLSKQPGPPHCLRLGSRPPVRQPAGYPADRPDGQVAGDDGTCQPSVASQIVLPLR